MSGTAIGEHYNVEALVRLCEGRMIYVLNDDRPDQPHRHCWDCGSNDTPRGDLVCSACGNSLPESQKFMLSARWDQANFDQQLRFYDRGLDHPGILWPDDVFVQEGQLCTLVRYRNEVWAIPKRLKDRLVEVVSMPSTISSSGRTIAILSQISASARSSTYPGGNASAQFRLEITLSAEVKATS